VAIICTWLVKSAPFGQSQCDFPKFTASVSPEREQDRQRKGWLLRLFFWAPGAPASQPCGAFQGTATFNNFLPLDGDFMAALTTEFERSAVPFIPQIRGQKTQTGIETDTSKRKRSVSLTLIASRSGPPMPRSSSRWASRGAANCAHSSWSPARRSWTFSISRRTSASISSTWCTECERAEQSGVFRNLGRGNVPTVPTSPGNPLPLLGRMICPQLLPDLLQRVRNGCAFRHLDTGREGTKVWEINAPLVQALLGAPPSACRACQSNKRDISRVSPQLRLDISNVLHQLQNGSTSVLVSTGCN
jgi:hypothetical protein